MKEKQYFILHKNSEIIENIQKYPTLKTLEQYVVNSCELLNILSNENNTTLLVASKTPKLNMQFITIDQIIVNKHPITLESDIYRIEIKDCLDNGIIKYIFFIENKWYWYSHNKEWEEISFKNFNKKKGNTSEEINNFKEGHWLDFNRLFNNDIHSFKISALLGCEGFNQSPKIAQINIWCNHLTKISIPSQNFKIENFYNRHEITWNNDEITTLQIFYKE